MKGGLEHRSLAPSYKAGCRKPVLGVWGPVLTNVVCSAVQLVSDREMGQICSVPIQKRLKKKKKKQLKIQTHKKFKRTLFIRRKNTTCANFRGKPLYQATKRVAQVVFCPNK